MSQWEEEEEEAVIQKPNNIKMCSRCKLEHLNRQSFVLMKCILFYDVHSTTIVTHTDDHHDGTHTMMCIHIGYIAARLNGLRLHIERRLINWFLQYPFWRSVVSFAGFITLRIYYNITSRDNLWIYLVKHLFVFLSLYFLLRFFCLWLVWLQVGIYTYPSSAQKVLYGTWHLIHWRV